MGCNAVLIRLSEGSCESIDNPMSISHKPILKFDSKSIAIIVPIDGASFFSGDLYASLHLRNSGRILFAFAHGEFQYEPRH